MGARADAPMSSFLPVGAYALDSPAARKDNKEEIVGRKVASEVGAEYGRHTWHEMYLTCPVRSHRLLFRLAEMQ